MIYRVEDGDFKDMTTQHMLAPIFSGLKAEKALSKGDLFIINDTLYKATANIALNATITIGTNAELASTISEELNRLSIPYCYNANTDITNVTNRTNAIKYVCEDFLTNYPKEYARTYSIRYANGYYASYEIKRYKYSLSNYDYLLITEYSGSPAINNVKMAVWVYEISTKTAGMSFSFPNS